MEHQLNFIDQLIALKHYYQQLVEEYERKFAHAKKQLSHVDALLDDQIARHKQQKTRLSETETAFDKDAIVSESPLDTSPPGSPELDLEPAIQEPLASTEHLAIQEPTQLLVESANTEPTDLHSTDFATNEPSVADLATNEPKEPPGVESFATAEATSNSQLPLQQKTASPVANNSKTKRRRHIPAPKTSLLPPYQHLTKSEAVEKLLHSNEGKILTIDEIIHALHGDLDAEEMKAEKTRMYDTLKKGVKNGLWSKVPGQIGCYTINLKLVKQDAGSTNQFQTSQRPHPRRSKDLEKVVPQYKRINFLEAVAAVMQENVGRVMTAEKVARALFGEEIEESALTQAKDKVGKNLWVGTKQERWEKVPGQLGCYMLGQNLVTS